ncbi:MAG: amino acid permease [Actinobacteria bacterium]|nr:amino acid permease [Actinomycetota bacterium]
MGDKQTASKAKVLGVFTLAMINVSLILNLRGLPMLATYGLSIVFYLVVAAAVFFIPTALISAELATGWPETGGIHAWTRMAFGDKWAFLVAWLEWLNCVIWLPTVLGALAAILGYVITPSLSTNRYFIVVVILVVFWGATLLNFRGMKASGRLSSLGAVFGVIIPGVLLVAVAAIWLIMGKPSEAAMTAGNLLPDLGNTTQLVFFIGVLLMFMGIEISSAHAAEVSNPQRDYPKAIFTSAAIIVAVFILGALAVAILVPGKKIDLLTGVVQAFQAAFDYFGMKWMVPILGIFMVFGMVAQINSWLIGPAKFMLATAENGDLPPFFHKVNKNDIPVNILVVQAGIVTLYSLVYLVMPSVNDSYWILTALSSQAYLIVYVIMFLVGLKLRYLKPDTPRAYRVPGGNRGMWVAAAAGVVSSIFAFGVGFVPPAGEVKGAWVVVYIFFLAIGITLLCGTAFLLQKYKKPEWKPKKAASDPRD